MDDVSAAGPIAQIVTYLLSFGLPGVCLIVLGWAYKNKEKRVDDLTDTITNLAREQGKGLAEATASIQRLSDLLVMRNKAE
jgi:hypothetical protein